MSNIIIIGPGATEVQEGRALSEGISASAKKLQDRSVEKHRRSKVRILLVEFLIFVNESMDDGHLKICEDELEFLDNCMENFVDTYGVEEDADQPSQAGDADQKAPAFGKEDVLKVAEEFKGFLSKAMDTKSLSGSEDVHDFIEGSFLEFLKSKNKLR